MLRKVLLTSLSVLLFCLTSYGFAEEQQQKGEKKEKSELAKLMGKIDKNYKAVEQISGYYSYKDAEWKIIEDSSTNLIKLSKIAIKKFARPDDPKYQKLNKLMLAESEKMLKVVGNKDQEGALEDAQWQVRRLRQTCAVCHKHLGIHLYPNLYPGKHEEKD